MRFHLLTSLLLLAGGTGCSTVPNQNPDAVAAAATTPTQLTAELAGTNNIDLKWTCRAGDIGGYFVDFTSGPKDDFVNLNIVDAGITTYHHPDLAPDTKFIYRIRPFFGPTSALVGIMTGPAPAAETDQPPGPLDEASAAAAKDPSAKSIRKAATVGPAAPGDLTAVLSAPLNVELRWRDHASDEDGYLVEAGTDDRGPFQVVALLPPNTTSYRQIQLPPVTKCYFRVRAFFYGKTSNLARRSTAPPLPEKPMPPVSNR